MSITTLQVPNHRTQKLRNSWSLRLFLSELLLKQWFEPVIPFTVMIGLAIYFFYSSKHAHPPRYVIATQPAE